MNKLISILTVGTTVLTACGQQDTESNRPNILFCIADDATFYHFSANGSKWINTPNFDRIAREGILFQNCYTPNAKSAPSRACILTGRNSWQLREGGNHITRFPSDIKVFTEALADGGYDVAYTGKGWAPGTSHHADGSPRSLTGKPFQQHKLTNPYPRMGNNNLAANLNQFLQERSPNQPFFFWMGSTEPHRDYAYGIGIEQGGKSIDMIDHVPAFWPDCDSVRTDMLDYAFEVEVFDRQIGEMLAVLERHNQLENTLIVVTSDNGMPFPRCKANNYEYANHMPLAVRWGDGIKNPGRSEQRLVSFIDFAPTFLDVAQIRWDISGMESTPGISLNDILRNKPTADNNEKRESILLGRERDDYGRPNNQGYPIRAIICNGLLYQTNLKSHLLPAGNPETGYLDVDGSPTKTVILNRTHQASADYFGLAFGIRSEEELYDIATDPDCIHNLADDPAFALRKEALRAKLFTQLKEQGDPRMGNNGDQFDNYPFDTDDKWNFYERVVNGEIKEPWEKTKWVNPSDYISYQH